ncbi:ATP-binding protein [Candidatus Peregrinibacteria bacterium]|nr:ATP-binding protein [Candidatus Peregrinibacteria bacterium]
MFSLGISQDSDKKESLLKSLAIYGPNASGKSSLVDALGHMKHFVISSSTSMQRGEKIQWISPFKLDIDSVKSPSVFEITFIKENEEGVATKYEYGFAITKEQIIDEWLYEYRTKRSSRLFLREYDSVKGKYKWSFGKRFSGKAIAERTANNVLFLSKAAQENHPYLVSIFDWFSNVLCVISTGNRGRVSLMKEFIENFDLLKPKILHMLGDADLGIVDIAFEKIDMDQIEVPDFFPEEVVLKLKEELTHNLRSVHKMPGTEESVSFDFLREESDGTKSILGLAKHWIEAAGKQQVIVVDELEKNLHPKLVRSLIEMFHRFSHGSQLIFTTHDIFQMDTSVFRRDQIVFAEKDHETQSTQLYKVSDIKGVRKEHVLDRRYMLGALGALPILGNFEIEDA